MTAVTDKRTATSLTGDIGEPLPRGGIAVGDTDTDSDAEPVAGGPADDDSARELAEDPAGQSTDGDHVQPTEPSSEGDGADPASATDEGKPSVTAGANDQATTSTSTGSAATGATTSTPAPTTTTVPTTSGATSPITSTPERAPSTTAAAVASAPIAPVTTAAPTGSGVACPADAAVQQLNVINVASDDVLNVRLGPGTSFTIVAGLASDATGVRVYGNERSGAWVKIVLPDSPSTPPTNGCGWVHASYLGAAS